MCDAISAVVVSGGVQAAGTARQVQAQKQAFKYRERVTAINADIARERAGDYREAGGRGASDVGKAGRKLASTQTAGYAAGGIDSSYGTVKNVIRNTRDLTREERDRVRADAETQARGAEFEAYNQSAQGQLLKTKADNSDPIRAALLSAAGSYTNYAAGNYNKNSKYT